MESEMTSGPSLDVELKSVPVMAYTRGAVHWGEARVREQIRVSTWLRTNMAPDYLTLYAARSLFLAGQALQKPVPTTELHIPVAQIIAYHLLPPAVDPLDYDPSEPNRRLEPMSAISGFFIINGSMRLSSNATVAKYLEVTREEFTGIYEAEIRTPVFPSLGTIKTPFVLVRQAETIFTARITS